MRRLIFLDTETAGLDARQDELVELTYATELGTQPVTLYFGVKSVPSFVDDMIGFTKRGIAGRKSPESAIAEFFRISEGSTMVAANPSFDKEFLVANDLFRFHYRMLDIESFAMAKLDLDEMPSMKNIYDILIERGFRLKEPDHTSKNDVLAMKQAYYILKRI